MSIKNFLYSLEGRNWLEEHYNKQNQSAILLAQELKTYPNMVIRAMKHWGMSRKDKSEAQKISLLSGRSKHPTKGTKRTKDIKERIGLSLYKYWKNISKEELEKKRKIAVDNWNKMTEEQKRLFYKNASIQSKKASREGSKFEKYLAERLKQERFRIIFHSDQMFDNNLMHIDIFLPMEGIAIEIDGPSHYYPIYGEEVFKKKVLADTKKNGLVLTSGYIMIRIKCIYSELSPTKMKVFTDNFIKFLFDLCNNPPKEIEKRYYEFILEE